MVDDIINIEETNIQVLQKAANVVDALKKKLEELSKAGKEGTEEFKKLSGSLVEQEKLKASLENLTAPFNSFKESISEFSGSFKKHFGAAGNIIGDFVGIIGDKLTEGLGSSVFALATLNDTMRGFLNPVQSANDLMGVFPGKLRDVNKAVRNLLTTQNEARQATLLFGDSFVSSDMAIKTANDAANVYSNDLRASAQMFAITTQELNEMNKTVRQVPDGFERASSGMIGMTKDGDSLVLKTSMLATTMRALGYSAQEAATVGKDNWFKFGESIEESIKQMGTMSEASRVTGIDRRTATEEIRDASSALAIFGRGSTSAANTWTSFMDKMRDGGVPIQSATRMVKDFVGSMANMSTESRAFISMVSGMSQGRTALGGALQLELAMRSEGGLEQNLDALTATLGKFTGGNVITLEQASKNPQLEMQFQVQREMLNKLAGVTKREDQNRMLEVLQGVQEGGIDRLEGSKEINNLAKQGQSIQEKQLTALERIAQATQFMVGREADAQIGAIDESLRGLSEIGYSTQGMDRIFGTLASADYRNQNVLEDTNVRTSLQRDIGEQLGKSMEVFSSVVDRRGGKADLSSYKDLFSGIVEAVKGGFSEALGDLSLRQPRKVGGESMVATSEDIERLGNNLMVTAPPREIVGEAEIFPSQDAFQARQKEMGDALGVVRETVRGKEEVSIPELFKETDVFGKEPKATTIEKSENTLIIRGEFDSKEMEGRFIKLIEEHAPDIVYEYSLKSAIGINS